MQNCLHIQKHLTKSIYIYIYAYKKYLSVWAWIHINMCISMSLYVYVCFHCYCFRGCLNTCLCVCGCTCIRICFRIYICVLKYNSMFGTFLCQWVVHWMRRCARVCVWGFMSMCMLTCLYMYTLMCTCKGIRFGKPRAGSCIRICLGIRSCSTDAFCVCEHLFMGINLTHWIRVHISWFVFETWAGAIRIEINFQCMHVNLNV